MNEYLIETNNLTKNFEGFTAVNDVGLKVPSGVVYGFLGPNGAGKSTTIRMLLGLIKPTEGEVKVFGKSIKTHRTEILKKVGSLVEYPSYYANLTAYENLDITRRILEVDKKEIDRVLEIVKLTEVKNKAVKKFSLGMKQRLGIANALLGNPEILILDEPTNGLDPAGIHEVRELIKSLPEKMGITVLVSSHLLSEIELMATQVGIINKGKLMFQGTLEELKKRSDSEIMVDARPALSAVKELENKGYNIEVRDKNIFVKNNNANAAHITKELVLSGHDVYHISEYRNSLEDIFLEITG